MAYGVRLEVWGEAACFTRSELKAERFSYDVMTPSAARAVLEGIFWHPGLRWQIDRIFVLSQIRFTNVRRNELKAKNSARNVKRFARKERGEFYQSTKADIQQRASTILKKPHYIIEAHFEMTEKATATDNEGKFREMFCRRARKGQCYHAPYLGCREFPARFRLYEEEELPQTNGETKDLGFMLYDLDYSDPKNLRPIFFQARLVNGVLDLRDCEVFPDAASTG